MAKQGTVVTLVDSWTKEDDTNALSNGLTPTWKTYTVAFGDSYTTGGESCLTAFSHITQQVLCATLWPTVVYSTSYGPYVAALNPATYKVLLYTAGADGGMVEVSNATDLYTSSSDLIKVTVAVYGY